MRIPQNCRSSRNHNFGQVAFSSSIAGPANSRRGKQLLLRNSSTGSNIHPYHRSHKSRELYNCKLKAIFPSPITISCTFNPLFKVLFTFPSWYLFAIGFESIFSFGWNLPPFCARFLKNATLRKQFCTKHGPTHERDSHPS